MRISQIFFANKISDQVTANCRLKCKNTNFLVVHKKLHVYVHAVVALN